MKNIKRICISATLCILLVMLIAGASAVGLDVPKRTPAQIDSFVASHPTTMPENIYKRDPVTKAPYDPGALKEAVLQTALNAVNQVRYAAGISSDVALNSAYTEKSQAAALVSAVNGIISHYPEKPADMADDLYQTGSGGAYSSNLGMGHASLSSALFNGWMHDGSSSNIDRIGHRRWVLDPRMTETGFGQVGKCTAMYVLGYNSSASVPQTVAWPAQTMPLRWMSSSLPWHVSFNDGTDVSNARVTLVRREDGKIWRFSASEQEDGYFNTNYGRFGYGQAVIFRPNDITYYAGDCFDVTVEGTGVGTLQYTVEIYSNSDPVALPSEATVSGGVFVLNNESHTATYSGAEDEYTSSVIIPATISFSGAAYRVTEIRNAAFQDMTMLQNVEIGKNITSIGENAFSGCINLQVITFKGKNVSSIGEGAFRKCSSLENMTIPKGVKTIGKNAFNGCKKLSRITVKTTTLRSIGKKAFSGIDDKAVFKCPQKFLDTYASMFRKAGAPKKAQYKK